LADWELPKEELAALSFYFPHITSSPFFRHQISTSCPPQLHPLHLRNAKPTDYAYHKPTTTLLFLPKTNLRIPQFSFENIEREYFIKPIHPLELLSPYL
jgi:hypothetical protein